MFLLLTLLISLIPSFLVMYFNDIPWYFHFLIFLGFYFGGILVFLVVVYVIGLIVANPKKEIKQPSRFLTGIVHMICKYITFLFNMKIKAEGLEKLEGKKYLFVSNHQAMMDPITIISSMPNIDLAFLMRQNVTKVPIIGPALVSCGFFPLNRENNREGLKTIVQAVHRLENGYPVGVFPEGKRSKGPEIGRFRDGAFKIATKSQSDIAILVVDNEYKIHFNAPFRRTTVNVKLCEILKYDDIKDMNTTEIGDRVIEIMKNNLKELREKK